MTLHIAVLAPLDVYERWSREISPEDRRIFIGVCGRFAIERLAGVRLQTWIELHGAADMPDYRELVAACRQCVRY